MLLQIFGKMKQTLPFHGKSPAIAHLWLIVNNHPSNQIAALTFSYLVL